MKRISPFLIFLYLLIAFGYGCDQNADQSKVDQKQELHQAGDTKTTPSSTKKVVLFFGNSLTAGYGLESSKSFPSLIQQRIDSLGLPYEVINAGVSGETTATGSNRIDWVLEQQNIDIFVLELGANDGLRGVPVHETKKNLEKIIDSVREAVPGVKIILAGMMIPPSMGPEYTESFKTIFPEIASSKNVELIPFLLKDVAGVDSLNLDDGIHPNAEGQKLVAENVWAVLNGVINQ